MEALALYLALKACLGYPAPLAPLIGRPEWELLAGRSVLLLLTALLLGRAYARQGRAAPAGIPRAGRLALGALAGIAVWALHDALLDAAARAAGGAAINTEGLAKAGLAQALGPAGWAAAFFGMAVQTPLLEETVYRDCLLPALERRWPGAPRALLALGGGAVFAVLHPLGHPVYLLPYLATGAALAWLYLRTRSLAAAVTAHATVNGILVLRALYA